MDAEIYTLQARGGVSRIFNEVLPRLCEMDEACEVDMVVMEGRLRQPLPQHERIRHHAVPPYHRYLRPGRLWRPVVEAMKWEHMRRQVRPPAHAIWQPTYFRPAGRWSGCFVVYFHDIIVERFAELFTKPIHARWRSQRQQCARHADVILCNSETTRQDVCDYFGVDVQRTRVIPPAVSDAFRPMRADDLDTFSRPTPRPYILYVGDRSPYKNFQFFLRAYARWPSRKDVDLVVVGREWTPEERQLLQHLKLEERVHLLQGVDDDALCALYHRAGFFVYPSLYEGFGIPLLEAMTCGCPIVASDIPSSREVAGELPIYFQPTAQEDLLRAMDEALHQGRRKAWLTAARAHASRFSWDATARGFWEVYHALAGT